MSPERIERERSEMTNDESERRLEELRDGDVVGTPGGDISKQEVPHWYDEKKFKRAKEVYRNYFASVNFSHLCGLLLSFYFTKNIKTLRSTGESETKETLFHRYLATIRHTQKWYEGDIWDPQHPAHRSLAAVRSMHARVGKKMSARGDGVTYVSQWDMAVTQWAFVGPMVLFKSKVGLHGCSDEDFDALIHFWRTVGYLLGIEDRYNLCDGDYDQVLAACRSLLDKEYRVRMREAAPESTGMARSVVAAMHMIDPVLTYESMSNYIHELAGLPCPDAMGWLDWLSHSAMRWIMQWLLQYDRPRAMFNDFTRWKLDMADKKDLKIMMNKRITNSTVSGG